MNENMPTNDDSGSGTKTIISIVLVILVCLGFAFYLFKISPQQESASAYNAALNIPSSPSPMPAPSPINPNTDHFLGNPNAKNVFVEYGDLQCPACAAYNDILNQVASQFNDTVFVFRYFPLVQVHQNAVEAALAAEAAGAQGKFWQMHDILFQKQSEWESMGDPLDTFATYAQQIGVANIDQFKSDVISKKYLEAIQKNSDESYALNLQGTPSLFFNGHPLKTGGDLSGLKQQAEPFLNK